LIDQREVLFIGRENKACTLSELYSSARMECSNGVPDSWRNIYIGNRRKLTYNSLYLPDSPQQEYGFTLQNQVEFIF
jgi:hypothetical protein